MDPSKPKTEDINCPFLKMCKKASREEGVVVDFPQNLHDVVQTSKKNGMQYIIQICSSTFQ